MLHKIIDVEPLADYRLRITFADGKAGEVDLSSRLFGPMFEQLKDENFFKQVKIDEFGALCWPNNADLAPDALYQQLH